MTLIKAPLTELQMQDSLSEENKKTVAVAVKNVEKLYGMVTQLLNLQRNDVCSDVLRVSYYNVKNYMIAGLGLFALSSFVTMRDLGADLVFGNRIIPFGFFIFLAGSFVVGASATILQVVINPYLTACFVKRTQPVQRLAIGGTANSIGTTIAPYFVTGIVFGGAAMDRINVSQLVIPFLMLMVSIFLVMLLLTKLSLPDIKGTRAEAGQVLDKSVWSFSHFTLGVIAIFFYVGVEVCIGANINMDGY